jgi:hypothetical protein
MCNHLCILGLELACFIIKLGVAPSDITAFVQMGGQMLSATRPALLDGNILRQCRLDPALLHVSFHELSVLELTFPEPPQFGDRQRFRQIDHPYGTFSPVHLLKVEPPGRDAGLP